VTFQGDKKFGKSLLAGPEERLKKVLLPLVPSWLQTYHLTASTVLWGLMVIVFSHFARYKSCRKEFLWAASLMIVAQYITDLLDGA
jgi:hypothetical protein